MRMSSMSVWFFVVMRKRVMMTYLKIRMPPVRVPVMRSAMRSVIMWVMKVTDVMKMRIRVMMWSCSMKMMRG